eukprot:Amastigsp_a342658_19.p2 type:complete len:415 gc:universal Amastigsp_a342658_19:1067-2311(+)
MRRVCVRESCGLYVCAQRGDDRGRELEAGPTRRASRQVRRRAAAVERAPRGCRRGEPHCAPRGGAGALPLRERARCVRGLLQERPRQAVASGLVGLFRCREGAHSEAQARVRRSVHDQARGHVPRHGALAGARHKVRRGAEATRVCGGRRRGVGARDDNLGADDGELADVSYRCGCAPARARRRAGRVRGVLPEQAHFAQAPVGTDAGDVHRPRRVPEGRVRGDALGLAVAGPCAAALQRARRAHPRRDRRSNAARGLGARADVALALMRQSGQASAAQDPKVEERRHHGHLCVQRCVHVRAPPSQNQPSPAQGDSRGGRGHVSKGDAGPPVPDRRRHCPSHENSLAAHPPGAPPGGLPAAQVPRQERRSQETHRVAHRQRVSRARRRRRSDVRLPRVSAAPQRQSRNAKPRAP